MRGELLSFPEIRMRRSNGIGSFTGNRELYGVAISSVDARPAGQPFTRNSLFFNEINDDVINPVPSNLVVSAIATGKTIAVDSIIHVGVSFHQYCNAVQCFRNVI